MNDRIDTTHAMERDREDMEDKRERSLQREDAQESALRHLSAEIVLAKAQRMLFAIDHLNELAEKSACEVARKYEVEKDTLLSHCQTEDGFVEGPPADLAGRLAWLSREISQSIILALLECGTEQPMTATIIGRKLRTAILAVDRARAIWRQQSESEKGLEGQAEATKTLTERAFPCAPNTPQGEIGHG